MIINKSKFLKGFFAGVAVSGVFAWWWNSESGKEVREATKDSMEEFYDFARPIARRFKKIAAKEYAQLKNLSKEKAEELVEKARFWQE